MATQQIRNTSEVALTQLTDDQLRARVARAQLYLIHMEPLAGFRAALTAPMETAYLRYLLQLELQGRLYGAGPVGDAQAGRDLAIVAAATRQEAQAIADNEPLQRAGLRVNRVQGHTMNEGVACYVGREMAHRAEASGAATLVASGDVSSLAGLRARAAGVQLQLIHLVPTQKPRPAEDIATGRDHFVWLRTHEMAARLMSCGPVEPASALAPGVWGGGMGVVAASLETAQAMAAAEPSGVMGYRTLSVEPWRMDYGLAAPIARALMTLNSLPPGV